MSWQQGPQVEEECEQSLVGIKLIQEGHSPIFYWLNW
jgi:hypothetical protein